MAQPVWNTNVGSIGTFPALVSTTYQLSASAVLPSTSLVYSLLGGSLPPGISINSSGLIFGTPDLVTQDTTSNFSVRVTDNLGNIRDRTFSMTITGSATPTITTSAGQLISTQDSIWIEIPIQYTNPDPSNIISMRIKEGSLPPGIEMNSSGVIRGYATPPTSSTTLAQIITSITETTSSNNRITCLSTSGFTVGRPVVFSGVAFGNIQSSVTYYIKEILNTTQFTISVTQNGSAFLVSDDVGFMSATLPPVSVGQPTIRTYNFVVELDSLYGSDTESYSITVINQNTPVSQGGPGKLPGTRTPTLYNTRPPTYNISPDDVYYGYYISPDEITPSSEDPSIPAFIGTINSGNFFTFKMIGHDFDGSAIKYSFSGLPLGLTGDTDLGWITGTPTLTSVTLNNYVFSVAVYKESAPSVISSYFTFSVNISNDVDGTIVWNTDSDLGSVFNGTVSILNVSATCDVDLQYRITSGTLPPNLTLLSNGEITGYVANQPTDTLLEQGDQTSYTFTVEAYSPVYPIIKSSRTFDLTVVQEFNQPTDTLYIKCTPDIEDRNIINSLLTDTSIIPDYTLYRPTDQYFGKANDVIYEHAYGIYASDVQEYIDAVTRNHYWRQLTLGEIKTAVAKNSSGTVIYEVVYSQVVDNLINPKGISIQQQITWPRNINLFLGPWYTSVSDIYTSYEDVLNVNFYTSLTSGVARTLYPNSLPNMRNRVGQVLGQEYDSRLLPLWMTSQQSDGSTLGYTPAWVICYTKPGFSAFIKNKIDNFWPYKLNQINFKIDRFTVNKSITYNYDNNLVPPAWTGLPSATPVPNPLDSKDFYVLFPRQTILPDQPQY